MRIGGSGRSCCKNGMTAEVCADGVEHRDRNMLLFILAESSGSETP